VPGAAPAPGTEVFAIEPPAEGPALDPLQREGAAALLDRRIERIAAIDGPDGMKAAIEDYRVTVHPDGALLLMMTHAPALEFAEDAVRHIVAEILEDTHLLADWTVVKSRVELNDTLVLHSLAAADGPDTPPADPRERAAQHAAGRGAGTPPSTEERETARARIERCAGRLTAFSLAAFGATSDQDEDDGTSLGVPLPQARLVAGALVCAIEVLIDELFQDIATLATRSKTISGVDTCLVLNGLPPRCAEQYTHLFAQRFLVTATVLTNRLTQRDWARPACVAEELALLLLIEQAQMVLDLYDLYDQDTDRAFAAFKDAALEGFVHEDPYAEDDRAEIDANRWFVPFGAPRSAHPYAYDPQREPRRS
jgi:hypothetical protein